MKKSNMLIFESDLQILKKLDNSILPSHKEIPQLHRCSIEYTKNLNFEKFNKLIEQIEPFFKNDNYSITSIDTRTHMLMEGMYPCIPGWHCDDFYRSNDNSEFDGLYKLDKETRTKLNENFFPDHTHYLINIGNNSLTEFLKNNISLPVVQNIPLNEYVYKFYGKVIDEIEAETLKIEPNILYKFGSTAFHRGTAAEFNGWRSFIRVTRSNSMKIKDELRYQSNVYIK